jgi:hypothetical protein
MIVDAWIQHPTPDFIAHPMFASLRRWLGLSDVPREVPVAMTVAALRAAGVDRALTCAWYGPDGPAHHQRSGRELRRRGPRAPDRGRLGRSAPADGRGARAAPRDPSARAPGAADLAVGCGGLPPNDRRYYPLYAECIELEIPFCLQVGHAGPLRASEPGRPIPYLDEVALEFPELVVVGGHIGYPWTDEMIALATKYPNVYIDTSAYKPRRYPAALVEFLRGHGRRKVLFGSNFPMLMPGDCLAEVDGLGLDAEARDRLLGR